VSEELLNDESVAEEEVTTGKKKKAKVPKEPKAKKRPSDFEIFRTILQRTSERKQAFLLRNLGEDPDILFLCSADEAGFTFGSPDQAISMIEFTDLELKSVVDHYLGKLHGLQPDREISGFVCLRDQISELGKTKGEEFTDEVFTNEAGSAWIVRKDNKDRSKPFYYALAIDSLFHVQLVADYCKNFRPLLDGNNADYLYYPYSHESNDTASIVTLPPRAEYRDHMLGKAYPHGFRAMMTKGLDIAMTKCVRDDFPYPVVDEEIIVWHDGGSACQLVHRVVAQGWRMITVRPNAIHVPTPQTPLHLTGNHQL
jgi:hypothetical protein